MPSVVVLSSYARPISVQKLELWNLDPSNNRKLRSFKQATMLQKDFLSIITVHWTFLDLMFSSYKKKISKPLSL